jgi:hypothetical protein
MPSAKARDLGIAAGAPRSQVRTPLLSKVCIIVGESVIPCDGVSGMGLCSARMAIEERRWHLSSRLVDLTALLVDLAGTNRSAFSEVLSECREVRTLLYQLRDQVEEHRRAHGC